MESGFRGPDSGHIELEIAVTQEKVVFKVGNYEVLAIWHNNLSKYVVFFRHSTWEYWYGHSIVCNEDELNLITGDVLYRVTNLARLDYTSVAEYVDEMFEEHTPIRKVSQGKRKRGRSFRREFYQR
jgi:hypothetical protein